MDNHVQQLHHGSSLLSHSDYVLAPPGPPTSGTPEPSSAWPSSQQNMTALAAVREFGPHARVGLSQVEVRRVLLHRYIVWTLSTWPYKAVWSV